MTPDPLDQPENPRIRTKTNRLRSELDLEYFHMLEKLRNDEWDVAKLQSETLRLFSDELKEGSFTQEIEEAWDMDGQLELLRRHIDHCRYTALFYRVDEGEVHPPHHHFNVASTQIIVAGKIRIREYERAGRTDRGTLVLTLASDRTLRPGDSFVASEWHRNVHWFQAIEGPAMVFNTNVRGFEKTTFDVDEGKFGRRYLDPTAYGDDLKIYSEEFDEAEAEKRFQRKPLDNFSVPEEVLAQLDDDGTA